MQSFLLRVFIFIYFYFLGISAYSQYITPFGVKGLGKSKGDKIWLRWAPTRVEVWEAGNKNGYIVHRFVLKKDGTLEDPKGILLTPTPLKPAPKAILEKLVAEPLAPALSQIFYPDNVGTTPRTPKEIFENKNEKDNRFGFALFMSDLSQGLAIASGLMLIDSQNLVAGKQYVYRIKLAVVPPNMPALEEGIAIIDLLPEVPISPPMKPSIIFEDKKAILKWETSIYKGVFGAYVVERSEDGKNFKSPNNLPFTPMEQVGEKSNLKPAVYLDSLADNRRTYYYRICGLTAFGEKSMPSEVVKGKGKDDLFAATVIEGVKIVDNKAAEIQWRFPEGYLKEIKGFKVRFAGKVDGMYQDAHKGLLSDKSRTFTHTPPFLNTYYYVQAIDEQGGVRSQSFPYLAQTEDRIPPMQPTGLVGKADTTGKTTSIVTLSWEANKDTDLLGYRVFRANSSTEEFREITEKLIKNPIFTDTLILNVLSKDVYYKVMAMDQMYNPSETSKVILVRRPDKVAPAAALFRNYTMKEEGILLQWDNSPSTDVARYALYRENKDSTQLANANSKITKKPSVPIKNTLLASWSIPEMIASNISNGIVGAFTDKTPMLGTKYRYTLVAIDSAGNRSSAKTGDISFETGFRKASKVEGIADREKHKIMLSWDKIPNMEVVSTYIYRSKNTEPSRLYQTISGDPGKFEDKDLSVSNVYTYKIQMLFKKRVRSIMTAPIVVKY